MPGSRNRRREVPFKVAAVVVAMTAVSFLAGERVGVALANRGNHDLADHVATATSSGQAQGSESAAPAHASGAVEGPGVSAECNTNYK